MTDGNPHGMLGVAVIGLGVGEQHALAYLRNENCRLRWLYDINREKLQQVITKLGKGSASESFEDILADKSVDVVSIASYDDAHYSQVMAALRAGKHVFVEKPLCRNLEELRSIKKIWSERRTRHLASNLVLRSAPLYRWLKEAIQGGRCGEVYAFDGDYLYGRIHKITNEWRKDVDDYSVMQGGGIHLVDLMLWLTGQKPVSVTATGNRICTAKTGFRYNDFVAAVFHFSSGLIGRITANFGCAHRHQHVVRVFGTKGTFVYDDAGPRWHESRDPLTPSKSIDMPSLPETKGDLIPEFIEDILEGRDAQLKTQHHFDVMSACLAADRALGGLQPVQVDSL